MPCKIPGRKVADLDFAVRARRMNEAAFSDINPHMRIGSMLRIEKHQIARSDFLHRNASRHFRDPVGIVRQIHTDCLLVYVADHPAAIHAARRILAAEAIIHSHQSHGVEHDFVPAACLGRRLLPHRRNRAPCNEQKCQYNQAIQGCTSTMDAPDLRLPIF